MLFCSYVIFLLLDQWVIERLSEAMGAALVGNNFSPLSRQFHQSFHCTWKKKCDWLQPEIYKALKPCCLLNRVSIARVVACFSQVPASLSRPAATAANSEAPVFVLACPTRASRAGECPRVIVRWFCPLYTFYFVLEQPLERLPDDKQRL